MASEIPDKDIQVAVRLIEKLASTRDERSKIKIEYDNLANEHDEHRRTKDARTNYLDVLSEVAQAVGEEIEPDNDETFNELTIKLDEYKNKLESASKETLRLRDLAEKLSNQAPNLWNAALNAYGKQIDLDIESDSERIEAKPVKNRYERDEDTNVEIVDQILNWKSDKPDFLTPCVIEDGFDRSTFFNLDLLASPRLQNRSDQKPLFVFDSIDIFKNVDRYKKETSGDLVIARSRFLSDLDFLSGNWEITAIPVFDIPFEPEKPMVHEVEIKSANLKSADKAALNRQILRIIEEELLGKKPVALVTDDLTLSRDAALIGAVIVDIDELYRG
jgi:hypothetical protein